jgi:hypothetical protein
MNEGGVLVRPPRFEAFQRNRQGIRPAIRSQEVEP